MSVHACPWRTMVQHNDGRGAGAVTMDYGAPSGQQRNVAGRRIVTPDRNVIRENL